MSRFLAPVVAFSVAGYVASVNAEPDGSVLTFVGIEYLAGPDLIAQGRMTWQLLVAFGVLTLGLSLRAMWRQKAD